VKRFLNSEIVITGLMSLLICPLTIWAKPLVPVSAITLSTQDEQALHAALPHDTQIVTNWIWKGNPLTLTLPLHQEKRLVFPEPVQVDVNGQLTTDQCHVINDHQSVYFTALKPFEQKTRIYITLKNSHQIIFLDVMTGSDKNTPSTADIIKIRMATQQPPVSSPAMAESDLPDHNNPIMAGAENSLLSYNAAASSSPADEWVQDVRWAWQQLYAPTYLLSNNFDFNRSPMHTRFWISGLFYSDAVFAHPLASWSRGDTVITAVELRNPYPHLTRLDLAHDLCGHWRATTVYPRETLQATGHKPVDSTTLFLISNDSFEQALGDCYHGRT
jgi:integrating conjugative element protein (TIGR03749 family)